MNLCVYISRMTNVDRHEIIKIFWYVYDYVTWIPLDRLKVDNMKKQGMS